MTQRVVGGPNLAQLDDWTGSTLAHLLRQCLCAGPTLVQRDCSWATIGPSWQIDWVNGDPLISTMSLHWANGGPAWKFAGQTWIRLTIRLGQPWPTYFDDVIALGQQWPNVIHRGPNLAQPDHSTGPTVAHLPRQRHCPGQTM